MFLKRLYIKIRNLRVKVKKDANFNEYGAFVGYLGVDHPPKTSPKWCPKRVKE